VTKWPLLRTSCSPVSCRRLGVEQSLEKPNRTANCTGVVDHGSQVFTVSPVAENQSAMRAVACRSWGRASSTRCRRPVSGPRNGWKSLVDVDDVVGVEASLATTNIVGVVSCSKGAGGGVVTNESTAESGYQRSKSRSFR
jgi:hypothetical protein